MSRPLAMWVHPAPCGAVGDPIVLADKRLSAMNKGVTTAQQEKAVRILDDLGIMMYASYMIDPAYTREDFRAMLAHVRRLKHTYATFTVMTPLPGTELHASREKELLSDKPELYDMLHALLPTTLPLPEFYTEMTTLWTKAVPFYRGLPTLARFGRRGMLTRLRLFGRFVEKARRLHQDLRNDAGENRGCHQIGHRPARGEIPDRVVE